MVRISIITRCPYDGKVVYRSDREAAAYQTLYRIRYGGRKQRPYRCKKSDGGWHLCTVLNGRDKKKRRRERDILAAWENEGGALA